MNGVPQLPAMVNKQQHVYRRLKAQHAALSLLLRRRPVPPQLLLEVGLPTADYNPEVGIHEQLAKPPTNSCRWGRLSFRLCL